MTAAPPPPARIYLDGGGDGRQGLDAAFAAAARRAGAVSCLYLPHAMQPARWAAAEEWFRGSYAGPAFAEHRMPADPADVVAEGAGFDAVFLSGGDTGRLLDTLRATGMDAYLKAHLARGGLLYGGSAGAIVCGRTIATAPPHEHSASTQDGLDLLGGASVLPHYGPGDAPRAARLAAELGTTVWALPEDTGVVVGEGTLPAAVGGGGWAVFPGPDAGYARRSGRILVRDEAGRVLLFRSPLDADRPDAGGSWITPGGGLDPGETPREGAARELAEETGLLVTPGELGPVVAETAGYADLGWTAGLFQDVFFAHRTAAHAVDTSGMEAYERRTLTGHRWWTLAELADTPDPVYPLGLLALLERMDREGVPSRPVRLPWHH
jgi:dipeptidase E